MRVFVTGGGTGGHFFPAAAVIEALSDEGGDTLYLGATDGIEKRLAADLPCSAVLTPGLKRHSLKQKLLLPFNIAISLLKIVWLFSDKRPQALLAAGGYVSLIPCTVAKLFGVPIYLMEQNRIAGRVVKRFAPTAKLVACSLPLMDLTASTELTGNPASKRLVAMAAQKEQVTTVKHLLIMGGSASAEAIDLAMAKMAAAGELQGISIVHIARPENHQKLLDAYNAAAVDAEVLGFCDDMPSQYAKADLVICRAGASSISELALFGLPAILVPYPYAVDDHQQYNAVYVQEAGAALLCEQEDGFKMRLSAALQELSGDAARVAAMSVQMRALAHPDAARDIAHRILMENS